MKATRFFITGAFAALLGTGVTAQTTVYETRDAEGNVSFSDESSPGSEAVDIQPTDVVDAPQPMPHEAESRNASEAGEAARQPGQSGTETIYEGGEDYLYDDPRARREVERHREDEGTSGLGQTVREDERHEAERYDANKEGAMGTADRAAERSDVTGPDAEYRNTQQPEHHEGGRR